MKEIKDINCDINMNLRKWKRGHGEIAVVEFYDDDGSWGIFVESEKKGTLFKIKGEKLIW